MSQEYCTHFSVFGAVGKLLVWEWVQGVSRRQTTMCVTLGNCHTRCDALIIHSIHFELPFQPNAHPSVHVNCDFSAKYRIGSFCLCIAVYFSLRCLGSIQNGLCFFLYQCVEQEPSLHSFVLEECANLNPTVICIPHTFIQCKYYHSRM